MAQLAGINYWPSNNKGGGGGGSNGGGGTVTPPTGGVIDPPDDRYYPGYREGLNSVGPRLIQTEVAFSLYGTTKPIHFGTGRMLANITWAKALSEKKLVLTNQQGGTDTSFQYYGTFRVSAGLAGDIDIAKRTLLRVWADGKLIIDNRASGRTIAKGVFYRFYQGTSDQPKDPTMVAFDGEDITPAYRDDIGIVFVDLPLGAYDNKIPVIAMEIGDADDEQNVVVSITAANQTSNQDIPLFNYNNMRVYLINAAGVDGWLRYDFNNNVFLGKVEPNKVGISQSGGTATSIETQRPIRIAPWDNTIFACPNGAENFQSIMALDPETGVVKAYAADCLHRPFTMQLGRVNLNLAGTQQITVLATTSDGNHVSYAKYQDSLKAMEFLIDLSSTAYDEDTRHCFGRGDTSGIDHFASNDDSVDLLRLTAQTLFPIPPTLPAAPVITTDYIPYDGGATTTVDALYYFASRNALLIIYANGEGRLVNLTTLSNIWRVGVGEIVAPPTNLFGDDTASRISWASSGGNIRELNLDTGEQKTFTVSSGFINPGDSAFHSPSKSIISFGTVDGIARRIFFEKANGNRVTVKKVIETTALLAGYTVGVVQVDASCDDIVDGAIITEPTSFVELVEAIKTIYGYTMYESGANIKVVNKGTTYSAPDFTLDGTDLIVAGREDTAFTVTRTEESVIPATFRLTYMDRTLNYYWNTAQATRSVGDTNSSRNQMEVKLPFIMEANDAKKLAYKALWGAWVGRVSYSFRMGTEYPEIEPGDVIAVAVGNDQYVIQALDVTFNPDFTADIEAIDFQPFIDYSVIAFGGTPFEQEISTNLAAELIYIDTPLLDREHESYNLGLGNRYYYIIAPTEPTNSFEGGTGFVSYNDGFSYVALEESTASVPTAFLLHDIAPAERINCVNFDETINVQLKGGDAAFLQSVTEEELYEGANMAVIGAPGRWEVIQFQTVTLELDGTYTLGNILRAAKGTQVFERHLWKESYAISGFGGITYSEGSGIYSGGRHRAGDLFVLIDDSWLKLGLHPTTPFDLKVKFAAARRVADAPDLATKNFDVTRQDIMPLPASCVKVTRDTNGFLTISWARNGRMTDTMPDDGGNPLVLMPDEVDTYDIFIVFGSDFVETPPNRTWDYEDPSNVPATQIGAGLIRPDMYNIKPVFNRNLTELQAGNLSFFGSLQDFDGGSGLLYRLTVSGVETITLSHRVFDQDPDDTFAFPTPVNILAGYIATTPSGTELATLDYDRVYVAVCQRSTYDGFVQPLNKNFVPFGQSTYTPSAQEQASLNNTPAQQQDFTGALYPQRLVAPAENANIGFQYLRRVFIEDV